MVDVVIWQEGDAFISQCLHVDVSSYGETVEEAADSLKEAMELHLSGLSEGDIKKLFLGAVQSDISLPSHSVKRTIPLDISS